MSRKISGLILNKKIWYNKTDYVLERGDFQMEAYTSFASVYDTFMDNIPYEEWSVYVKELLEGDGRSCAGTGLWNRDDDGTAGVSGI